MTVAFIKFVQKLSPATWIAIAAAMLLLGLLSACRLHQNFNDYSKDQWVRASDSIGSFINNTIQLTFYRNEGAAMVVLSDSVRIAPPGMLNPKAEFNSGHIVHRLSVFAKGRTIFS